jgi:hypothetical protein
LCHEPLQAFLDCTDAVVKDLFDPAYDSRKLKNTSCWRGYVGTWKIESDRLYLVSIDPGLCVEIDGEMTDLIAAYPQGLFAHWFTGELRCPRGKQMQYIHVGYASVFEEDLLLQIKRGQLVNAKVRHNGRAHPGASEGYSVAAFAVMIEDDEP